MNPIEKHKWDKRVLVINARSASSVGYKRQEELFNKGKLGMKERDLVIYKLYPDHWIGPDGNLSQEEALSIREVYQIPKDTFMVLLIGKDGSIKMKTDDLVSARDIFALIDQMPMRRREMRDPKDN